jgi:hypothetical protein
MLVGFGVSFSANEVTRISEMAAIIEVKDDSIIGRQMALIFHASLEACSAGR